MLVCVAFFAVFSVPVSPYLPLGESQIHLASALGSNSLVLLQASADNAGGDGQVAVVAIETQC
jgi:hypothetical protein